MIPLQGKLEIRPARFSAEYDLDHPENADVRNVWLLLGDYARERLLLARTREDIRDRIANFRIAELNGHFIGCAALRDYGNNLYEVRSLAVDKEYAGHGVGSMIVSGIIDQMRSTGRPACLFALTYRDHFFERLGFRVVKKEMFPGKIWSDCAVCSKKDHCDEIAVLLELNTDGSSGTAAR